MAEASFNTEKLSISAGSTSLKRPSSPSIKTKALELAPKVPIPRTQNSEIFLPGSPLLITEIIPGTRPPNTLLILVAGICKSSAFTLVIAPTTLIFRCVPIPITTASSSMVEDSVIRIVSLSSGLFTRCS